MSERYSAGVATAYGAALRGGYTGTYNDFCIDIWNTWFNGFIYKYNIWQIVDWHSAFYICIL